MAGFVVSEHAMPRRTKPAKPKVKRRAHRKARSGSRAEMKRAGKAIAGIVGSW